MPRGRAGDGRRTLGGRPAQGLLRGILIAARELGAAAVDVHLPAAEAMDASERIVNIGQNALSANPEAMENPARADIVVDYLLLLFSKE